LILVAEFSPRSRPINRQFRRAGAPKCPVIAAAASLDSMSNDNNPGEERRVTKSYVAGRLDEFAEGSRKVISCDGTEVGVFKIDGELVAWHNECAHLQGPVCQGRIYAKVEEPVDANGHTRMLHYNEKEKHIVCPWHGWEFSLKTGKHPTHSTARLRKARLEVNDGQVYVVL
jgi:nitrite reductase/ring-hydroxylating ferredoxin subunit